LLRFSVTAEPTRRISANKENILHPAAILTLTAYGIPLVQERKPPLEPM
jgi:hypothetical protein